MVAPQAMTAEEQVLRECNADNGGHIYDSSKTPKIQNVSENDYTRQGTIIPEPGPIMPILPKGTPDQENARVDLPGGKASWMEKDTMTEKSALGLEALLQRLEKATKPTCVL